MTDAALRTEVGQMEIIKFKIKITFFGNYNRVGNGILEGSEKHLHLLSALKVELVGLKAERSAIGNHSIHLNTHKGGLSLGIRALKVMNVVGGNHWDTMLLANKLYAIVSLSFIIKAVVLHLKVEVVTKNITQFKGCRLRLRHATSQDKLRNFTCNTGRKCNKTLAVSTNKLHIHSGL